MANQSTPNKHSVIFLGNFFKGISQVGPKKFPVEKRELGSLKKGKIKYQPDLHSQASNPSSRSSG